MKSFIIILCVLAFVIGGFALVMLLGKQTNDVTTTVQDVSVEGVGASEQKSSTGTGSLLSLQALNKDLECQVVYATNDGKEVEGTYFVSEGKIRGDFVVPAPEFGGEIVSSLIVDGPMTYVWSQIGAETYGFKKDKNTPVTDGRVESKEPVPLDADVRYSCTDWEEVDGSVFVPPTTVDFKDLSAVIEAGMEYGN